jgi:ribonuclease P protein component
VLSAQHRLRSRADFSAVLRSRGHRVGSRLLVVHTHCPPDRRDQPTRVGFVVSKAVGGAVVRNRTKRRLRHLCAARLSAYDLGVDVVVRANPAAAEATSAELGAALDAALRVLRSRCARS